MTVDEKQKIIEEELLSYDDWDDRISYIIEKGYALPEYPLQFKTNEFLIKECQSKLWIYCECKNEICYFLAHSETVITKGIVALFIELYSNVTPTEILNTPITFLEKSGMLKLFSNRITGINGLIKTMHQYAINAK